MNRILFFILGGLIIALCVAGTLFFFNQGMAEEQKFTEAFNRRAMFVGSTEMQCAAIGMNFAALLFSTFRICRGKWKEMQFGEKVGPMPILLWFFLYPLAIFFMLLPSESFELFVFLLGLSLFVQGTAIAVCFGYMFYLIFQCFYRKNPNCLTWLNTYATVSGASMFIFCLNNAIFLSDIPI